MKLFKHQEEALELTKGFNRCAYYLDMGLGKTFVGSEKMKDLNARVNLIICQKSKVDDWFDHIKQHYNKCIILLNLTDKKQFEIFIEEATKNINPIIGIINYDLVHRRSDLAKLQDFTLMLDESSLIQNEQSKRSRFILKKLKPKNVILLSGTPTGGKYEKLWSQLHLLGWDINKTTFYNTYVNYVIDRSQGFPLMKIFGYKNIRRLKQKMRDYGCVFMKTDEVINLPDQIDNKINVPITSNYKKFRKNSIVEFDGIELVGDTSLTKMLYERQLCGQYNADKLKAFEDLLESTNDRLVVFYNFNEELNKLIAICEVSGRPYSQINGSVKDLYAYENKSDSVTFCQYQAGAMGLNLQKANHLCYFTPPLGSEIFEQSKKRIHRMGQNKTCFYYYLVCKGSIEEKIYKTLEMRRDYTNKLFEGGN